MIKLYPEPINKLCNEIYFAGIITARIKIFNRNKVDENGCNTDLSKMVMKKVLNIKKK